MYLRAIFIMTPAEEAAIAAMQIELSRRASLRARSAPAASSSADTHVAWALVPESTKFADLHFRAGN